MSSPFFSVCIPNFNHGRYIRTTIESVLAQSFEDFEIVVADNASTDDSVAVIESIRSNKVRLFRNSVNVGFAPNLDRVVARATGRYVIVLSSDDLMLPGALAAYADAIGSAALESARALFVSAVDVIDSQGKQSGAYDRDYYLPRLEGARRSLGDGTSLMRFDGHAAFRNVWPRIMVPGHFCTMCFSRELFESVGGYASTNLVGPDCHFSNKLLLRGAPVYFIERRLFAYRIHQGGQLGTFAGRSALKSPVDLYIFTIQYTDSELAEAGARREDSIGYAVREGCLKAGLRLLADGFWVASFRHLAFAFASYPGVAVREPLSYLLALGLLGGPAGTWLARAARRLREEHDR